MDHSGAFRSWFGDAPSFRVVVPGRVNLMGDHIDYNGLSVLPMAMQRRIALLVRHRADPTIHIRSTNPLFAERSFPIEADPPPFAPGDWGNYAKAALQELHGEFAEPRGFDALVDSDIPIAAGLSSSSALVVGFALALLHANGRSLPPLVLAARLARAERYVGTRGGGMDQAAILAARSGCAVRVDFGPLAVTTIHVPHDWRFVVAFSMIPAEKSGKARDAYNLRVRECRAALAEIAERLGSPHATWAGLIDGHTVDDLRAAAASAASPTLSRRFGHVLSEALRVRRCEAALGSADAVAFGTLMNQSHESLREDFAVSIPPLDRLAADCRRAGAYGARLTGAGFGGCVVALADESSSAAVQATLARGYYTSHHVTGDRLDRSLFLAHPSGPARVEDMHG